MSSRYRSRFGGFGIGGGWTPAVKSADHRLRHRIPAADLRPFSGSPAFDGQIRTRPRAGDTDTIYLWQLVTYIFLHGGFFHILFNMFGLYMFGSELEIDWGTREFTKFFFICGIGAALTSVLAEPEFARTDHRRVRRDLRIVAGVWLLVSRSHHLPLHGHPDSGEVVRRDLRRDHLSVRPFRDRRRRRLRCSSGRHARRFPLPERRTTHSRTCADAMTDGSATACAGSLRSITTNARENDDQEKRRWRN